MNAPLDDSMPIDGRAREAIYSFAHTMLEADRLEPAVKAFRVLVRFAPTDERAWLGLAACHEKLGQDEVAAELYGAGAVVATPPSARCRIALARIARQHGDFTEADEHLEIAASLADAAGDTEVLALVRHERRRP